MDNETADHDTPELDTSGPFRPRRQTQKKTITPLQIAVAVVVLFGIVMFVSFTVTSVNPPKMMHAEFAIRWLIQVIGFFMAATSSLMLLVRCVGSGGLKGVEVSIVPLLAGLMMMQSNWSLALAIALIVVAIIVREICADVGWRKEGNEGH